VIQEQVLINKRICLQNLNAFPDAKFTIDDQIAEGDKVVMHYTITGIHKGDFQGIAATGKSIKIIGIAIHRIVNGKNVEIWTNWDAPGLMHQLGAISLPGQ
jgi:predicted ester cyclase